MSIVKNIGKNTLGDSEKISVDLRTYNRSTHNLSYAWRSTMGVGTLVPCFKQVALPGDTWDIEIDSKVLTHPTIGPLFGSYKMQIDFFTCPMRLYIAPLHNNALNVGLDMSRVKIPQMSISKEANKKIAFSNSSVLAYLGWRGISKSKTIESKNALPLLSYIDIFKNYYANKQEDIFYALFSAAAEVKGVVNGLTKNDSHPYEIIGGNILVPDTIKPEECTFVFKTINNEYKYYVGKNAWEGKDIAFHAPVKTTGNWRLDWYSGVVKTALKELVSVQTGAELEAKAYNLQECDELRERILSQKWSQINLSETNNAGLGYISDILGKNASNEINAKSANSGLLLKTLQSDIFNNWVKTEWINQINEKSSVAVVNEAFTMDSLNLAKKVYDMLNRIAVSGGTYRDWMETVYTAEGYGHVETPIYEGGMSSEIQFEEVVSNSASGAQPLGTLGGRGVNTNKKGGKLHIKITEPSYIIGIASITPRVDYSQGNEWDGNLKTMDDLHKPALDGIGFQDLLSNTMTYEAKDNEAIGKVPAWINYMTNYNQTFGNFAAGENEAFMCLNRIYETDENERIVNASTYINPEDYIYQFAERSLEAQDFWVQIGYNVKARRVMSAKSIPNF